MIVVNGEQVQLDNISVSELLVVRKVKNPTMVVVKLNDRVLDRKAYDTILNDGDQLEFMYFMGGGTYRLLNTTQHNVRTNEREAKDLLYNG